MLYKQVEKATSSCKEFKIEYLYLSNTTFKAYKIYFNKLQVCSTRFVYAAMFILTLIGIINVFIHKNFNWKFHHVLIDSNYLILWQSRKNSSWPVDSENDPKVTGANFFLRIIPTFLIYTTRNVKDIYIELFPIAGILSLWLVSRDFQENMSLEFVDHLQIQQIMNNYKAICKLSKIFSQGHGVVLLLSILNNALYYSCSIGDYIFTITNFGKKFYIIEYLFIFSTFWALATTFENQVYTRNTVSLDPETNFHT